MEQLKRRNLSGIYIFDKFPSDEKRLPTCVEDCTQETRREWCMGKTKEYLRSVIESKLDTYKSIVRYLMSDEDEDINKEQCNMLLELADALHKNIEWENWTKEDYVNEVDTVCAAVRTLADSYGVEGQ